VLDVGRLWVGWTALRSGEFDVAASWFAGAAVTGWPTWVAGRRAFENRDYAEAAKHYSEALTIWRSRGQNTDGPPFFQALGPHPDMAVALSDLGGAQLLSGDLKSATATLDVAIKTGPGLARPWFLRARAHELAGEMDSALADYNMASRTAFAGAQDQASGEAHLYRGIAFYRRKDFGRAENEFASALNFEIPAPLRPDAVAWRQLAAVAGGSCANARDYLERSLASVSPYFPAAEARSMETGCVTVLNNGISKR
jgi:tetratricopeptide (TPR) repeat protein